LSPQDSSPIRLSKKRAKFWLAQAKRDLQLAELSLNNGFYEWSCYCSQQAGEKKIKSILFTLEIGLEKKDFHIHNLISISRYIPSDLISDIDRLESLCYKLSQYLFTTRYPDITGEEKNPGKIFNKEDGEEALQAVNELFQICDEIVTLIKAFRSS